MDELANSCESSIGEATHDSSCNPRDARCGSGPIGRTDAVMTARNWRLRAYIDSNAKERAKRQGVAITPEVVR
jgi:hypothetical protein